MAPGRSAAVAAAVAGDGASGGAHAEQHAPTPAADGAREVLLFDFSDRLVPYEQAWAWQRRRVDALCGGGGEGAGSDSRDSVLLLQHPPTYTLGAGSTVDHVKFDLEDPPFPIYRTERGGEVTYHGPGQLVMYPILDLGRHTRDLHWYLRSLEEVVIRALAAVSGLEGERVDGLTGVWVGGAKLAAIGVRARKWVTFHGLALNVAPDLSPFGLIVPCGIGDRPVASVESALGLGGGTSNGGGGSNGTGGGVSNSSGGTGGGDRLLAVPGGERRALLLEYRFALVEALEEVFGLRAVLATQEDAARLLGPDAVAGGGSGGGGGSEGGGASFAGGDARGEPAGAAAPGPAVAIP